MTVGWGESELAANTVDLLSAHVANTRRAPDVHRGALSGAGVFVMRISCCPSGVVTYTSCEPSRFEMKAMASPCGETDGSPPFMTGRAGCCAAASGAMKSIAARNGQ